jgi:hypothetical protein
MSISGPLVAPWSTPRYRECGLEGVSRGVCCSVDPEVALWRVNLAHGTLSLIAEGRCRKRGGVRLCSSPCHVCSTTRIILTKTFEVFLHRSNLFLRRYLQASQVDACLEAGVRGHAALHAGTSNCAWQSVCWNGRDGMCTYDLCEVALRVGRAFSWSPPEYQWQSRRVR